MAEVYPKAPGMPLLSGNAIPTIYSKKLRQNLYAATCFKDICNTDYEGEITKWGDMVKIRTIPTDDCPDYVDGQPLVYSQLQPTTVDLLINQGHYWGFKFSDVDKKQSDIDYISEYTKMYAQRMKIKIDANVFSGVIADAAATNKGNTAGVVSGSYALGAATAPFPLTNTNGIDWLCAMQSCLGEQNVANDSQRFVVIPEAAAFRIRTSDLKDASMTGDNMSTVRTDGRLGRIGNLTIYVSNNIHSAADTLNGGAVTAYDVIFGHKSAITFAMQLTESEIIPNPTTFGKLYRGLVVYGFGVIQPAALGVSHICLA